MKKISEIKEYIDSHIEDEINLTCIAERFGVSKFYLCHTFRNIMGITLVKYINIQRISVVKKFIEDGDTLTIAASKAGFGSYNSFYKSYRQFTGKKPSEKQKY